MSGPGMKGDALGSDMFDLALHVCRSSAEFSAAVFSSTGALPRPDRFLCQTSRCAVGGTQA